MWIFFIFNTPPKFNIAPEKRRLEDDPFLLGFGLFSGATVDGWNPAPVDR